MVGGVALTEHINTLATTNQYGHVRLATSLDDNDTGVAPSIELLNGEFANKFVTNDNILGGISTQTIFGYDSFSDVATNNNIYNNSRERWRVFSPAYETAKILSLIFYIFLYCFF